MPEVPGELGAGRGRARDEGDQALVAGGLDDDADRAEPVAERGDALEERRHAVEPRQRQLDAKRNPSGTVSAQRLN